MSLLSIFSHSETKITKMFPYDRHLPRNSAVKSTTIWPAFDVLDADRDGRISHDDLHAFFTRFTAASDDDIAAMISVADADRSGFVEFEEFERVLAVAGGGIMEDAFRLMDRDGDGRVGFEDLKAYLAWVGMPTDDEDVREMIRSGGCEEYAGVGFNDLLRILAVDYDDRVC